MSVRKRSWIWSLHREIPPNTTEGKTHCRRAVCKYCDKNILGIADRTIGHSYHHVCFSTCRNSANARYLKRITINQANREFQTGIYVKREKKKSNVHDEFDCGNFKIPNYRFCDGENDCEDGIDEIRRNLSLDQSGIPCRRDGFVCMLPENLEHLQSVVCIEDAECNDDEFKCTDGSGDNSDKNFRLHADAYKKPGHLCRSVSNGLCYLPESQAHKALSLCVADPFCRSDELLCQHPFLYCKKINFCVKSVLCTNLPYPQPPIYPRKRQAGDMLCPGLDYERKNRKCSLPGEFICDSYPHCSGAVDECFCDGNTLILNGIFHEEECFRCFTSKEIIPYGKLCDHVIDCQDLSDECLCKRKGVLNICKHVDWGRKDETPYFSCNATKANNSATVCDKIPDCMESIDEKFCADTSCPDGSLNQNAGKCNHRCDSLDHDKKPTATSCDGNIECLNYYAEECSICYPKPEFCKHRVSETHYECSSKSRIIGWKICDGIADCEEGEEEIKCPRRFYCKGNEPISVPEHKVCNLQKDCEDSSDEMNCNEITHFYCNDTGNVKFISKNELCDGSQDCKSARDECLPECIVSAFSDANSMIKNTLVLATVWVTSTVTLAGNAFVMIFSTIKLYQKKKKYKKNAIINKILICNLSASDFLVGVYTMTICVKSLTMQGEYCKEDIEWRSGTTCSAIGALLMIGTESSVFTLTIITGFRVYTLLRPFIEVSLRTMRNIIVSSWTLTIALAAIPLLPVTEDYFVDNVWLSQNPFFSIINKKEIREINQWISTIQTENNDTLTSSDSWSALETMLKRLNPKFNIDRKFGYYSSHTVCLPTVFPNPMKDMAWGYSLIFLIINFLAFFVISIGYFVIYKNSTQQNRALTNQQLKERAKNMQKKVTMIIITDFLCWMPICIMGFLQVAGMNIPNDAYLPVGLMIIPINSMLNPILYYVPSKAIKYLLALFTGKKVHAKHKPAIETPEKKIGKNEKQHGN
ncbi:uncharacterized protein LOC120338026 [Styela clava]